MTKNKILAVVLCLIGAILGIVLIPIFFIMTYQPMIIGEEALGTLSGLGCAVVVEFIFPFISDIGIIAGVLYLLSAIAFIQDDKRAFTLAIIANVLAIQSAFWPIVPAIITAQPPLFPPLFFTHLIIYFLLMGPIARFSGKTALLGLIVGMAWVLSFMNGVAATNRIVALGWPLFTAMQRLNWIASIGFGIATVGIALRPSEWVRKVGLGAAILEAVAGFSAGLFSPFEGFSLFLLGPILATVVLVLFISPKYWQKITSKGFLDRNL
ncbi:MAG: hypothetical protein ACFE9I_04610 [Candidatus Hermodarchaeota archaeon]